MFRHPIKTLFIALPLMAFLPAVAVAGESWTKETAPGSNSWVDNPACTGTCAAERDAARSPARPTPGAPIRIEGEKPKPQKTTPRDSNADRRQPPAREVHYGFCCAVDGRRVAHTAALRNEAKAAQQCKALSPIRECSGLQRSIAIKALADHDRKKKAGG